MKSITNNGQITWVHERGRGVREAKVWERPILQERPSAREDLASPMNPLVREANLLIDYWLLMITWICEPGPGAILSKLASLTPRPLSHLSLSCKIGLSHSKTGSWLAQSERGQGAREAEVWERPIFNERGRFSTNFWSDVLKINIMHLNTSVDLARI